MKPWPLLEALYPRLMAIAQGCGLDPEDAADAVQDTMLAFWLRRDQIRSPKAWAVLVVRRRSLDLVRARAKLESAAEVPGSGRIDEEALLNRLWLTAGAQRLSKRERAILRLLYVAGLDLREMAVALGCAPGSVNTLAARARKRLRRHLMRSRPAD